MRSRARLAGLVTSAVVAAGCGALAPTAAGTRSLATGFFDGAFASSDAGGRAAALDSSRDLGATVVRVPVTWAAIAPSPRPAAFAAANPRDPTYRFALVDAAVREATARGLTVLLSFNTAPAWAEGAHRPRGASPGSWRPSARAVGDFATALARRYDGTFSDPERPGSALPRVRHWQLWNEPNLSIYLSPQWERAGRRLRPAAPRIYRAMLNAFYRAVKAVDPGSFVLGAGTAPYGDPAPGGARLQPVLFLRESAGPTVMR
jgi:aryl-phospho-beta-D-glucosidase BglC (GH1 family)